MGGSPTVAGRELHNDAAVGHGGTLKVGEVEIDLDATAIRTGSGLTPLPLQEYLLLRLLMDHPGQVLTRRYLLDHGWQPGFADDHKSLDVHMYRLRSKLRSVPGPCPLRTVRSVGYVFDRPADNSPPHAPAEPR